MMEIMDIRVSVKDLEKLLVDLKEIGAKTLEIYVGPSFDLGDGTMYPKHLSICADDPDDVHCNWVMDNILEV